MKRNLTMVLGSLLFAGMASAQQWVETAAQNKKVVIEEFTGIHCTFCPDGHKTANELIQANPGKVFAVNIHSGGYATPQAGEPDMRTAEGDIIDDASGLRGYPAASVNRYRSPRVEPGTRSTWAASVNSQLTEPAAANAFVKSYYDRTTKELTTEVEVFYTSKSATATNKVTVMLLQDNILGPQTGGKTFYPENYVGDDYIHNHVLRDVISDGGAWGEVINNTDSGALFYKKYVTKLPDDIKDIPLSFFNLEVLVFVSEGDNNNIMAAFQSEVEYDNSGAVDLSMVSNFIHKGNLCMDPITPSVVITNSSTDTVKSFDIGLSVNNLEYTKSFSGTLLPNEKTTITFDDNIIPRGEFNASITGFKNINGGDFFDTDISNDNTTISGIGFQSKAFDYGKFGFNNGMDANAARNVKDNTGYVVVTSGGHTGGAIRYSIHESWGLAGKSGEILVGEADFTNVSDPQISFYYAYSDGSQGGTAPDISVSVSEDCGASFIDVDKVTCKSTGEPSNPQNFYIPSSGEYRKHTVSLSAFANKSIIISVAGIPGSSGNALYIDEIEVGGADKIASLNEVELTGVNVYPNPSKDVVNVTIEDKMNSSYELTDINGRTILSGNLINGSGSVNVSELTNGVYLLQVANETGMTTKRITVSH